MTEAAAATGAAENVSAATGPALPDHLQVALALQEAVTADVMVERAEAAVRKAQAQARQLTENAQNGLESARAAKKAADAALAGVTGESGEAALASLKEAAQAAQAAYDQAAMRLGGGE